jgi:transcriptional regulator with XRE-family HTH domain
VQHTAHIMRSILHSQLSSRDDVLTHLSTNLRRLRRSRGLSQGDLATKAGLSRRIISAIEGGAANVSLSTVDRLAAALDAKFTDMVRSPGAPNSLHIESIGWRGKSTASIGILLGAAPGSRETELWLWSLGPGERYPSEYGSAEWHEILFCIEGTLTVETVDRVHTLRPDKFVIFSSGDPYTFVNGTDEPVRYVRGIVL